MKWYAVPPAIMAGICFIIGMYYILYFLRMKKRLHLYFALTCFSLFLYDMSCAGLYNASSVNQGIYWQKANFIFISLISVILFLFILEFTRTRNMKLLKGVTVYYIIMTAIIVFYEGNLTLTLSNPMVREITLACGITVTYFEAVPGLIPYLLVTVSFILVLYSSILLVRHYRRTRDRAVLQNLLSLFLFFVCAFSDTFTGSNLFNFIYLMEYGFMFVILSMSNTLVIQFANVCSEVEKLNIHLEHKVAERTSELIQARDALWGEMKLAMKIQTVLLPRKPAIPGYEIAAYMKPAEAVGGDYYDIIPGKDTSWLTIGDVSGHGVSAGLIMMMAQSAIRAIIQKEPGIAPTDLVRIISRTISHNISSMNEQKFMLLTVFQIAKGGTILFTGRHQPFLLYNGKEGKSDYIYPGGIFISELKFQDEQKNQNLSLEENDALLIFTDGIIEAQDAAGNFFSYEKLQSLFEGNAAGTVNEIMNRILKELETYTIADDITLIVLKKMK